MHYSVQQVRGVIQMQVCTLFDFLTIHIKVAEGTPGECIAFEVRELAK
jgi:hypothetical protein